MDTNQALAQGSCTCKKPRPGYKFVEVPVSTKTVINLPSRPLLSQEYRQGKKVKSNLRITGKGGRCYTLDLLAAKRGGAK